MKSPTSDVATWLTVDETASTQTQLAELLREGSSIRVVFAHHQVTGRGRFGRTWISQRGESLTYSLAFSDYADHPKPHLVGMTLSVAAASVIHSQLRWPNDLVVGGKKIGGILTEMIVDADGRRIPVVGIGINLNQASFPEEIASIATSLKLARGGAYDPQLIGQKILDRLEDLPEPTDWAALAPIWNLFDATPGKRFRLPNGDEAIAIGIGSDGELMCSVNGESQTVLAAEALFG